MSQNATFHRPLASSLFQEFLVLLLLQRMLIWILLLLVNFESPCTQFMFLRITVKVVHLHVFFFWHVSFFNAELPPRPLLEELARELRQRLVNSGLVTFSLVDASTLPLILELWVGYMSIADLSLLCLGPPAVQRRHDPPERDYRSLLCYWHQLLSWSVSSIMA